MGSLVLRNSVARADKFLTPPSLVVRHAQNDGKHVTRLRHLRAFGTKNVARLESTSASSGKIRARGFSVDTCFSKASAVLCVRKKLHNICEGSGIRQPGEIILFAIFQLLSSHLAASPSTS